MQTSVVVLRLLELFDAGRDAHYFQWLKNVSFLPSMNKQFNVGKIWALVSHENQEADVSLIAAPC